MDTNGLRGAVLAMTGVAAHVAAETTGSKTAARVEAWVDGIFADDEKEHGDQKRR